MKTLLLILFATATLSAQPVITGVSPASGPVAGGTTVAIQGSGFEACPICSPPLPPRVFFGGVEVREFGPSTSTSLVVKLPPHLPANVDVVVEQWNGATRKADAFTYTGNVDEVFDRLLLPLFLPPVHGAFGSEFHTQLRMANTSPAESTYVFGLQAPCVVSACIPIDNAEFPYDIGPNESIGPGYVELTGTPGRFLYIAKTAPDVFANLRVFAASRSAFNFGTEIPVVRDEQFIRGPIKLLGVPLDPRFRNTLRIYAIEAISVVVNYGNESHPLMLRRGLNLFEPAYAEFGGFPIGTGTIDVTIAAVLPAVVGIENPPMWAFVSVTNNDTQLITTITPQR
jgi:IPT/TIG domain